MQQKLPEKLTVTHLVNLLSKVNYFVHNFTCYFAGVLHWSLTLKEEHRLTVFENRRLRRMYEPKRDKLVGDGRRLCKEDLNNMYTSPDIKNLWTVWLNI
jgi:hypothetical protein